MKIRNERTYALRAPTGELVNPGDHIEVDEALGNELCEQPANWSLVKATKPKNTSEED